MLGAPKCCRPLSTPRVLLATALSLIQKMLKTYKVLSANLDSTPTQCCTESYCLKDMSSPSKYEQQAFLATQIQGIGFLFSGLMCGWIGSIRNPV